MQSYFWIAVGSALGGMGRHWCSLVMARMLGEGFPWGTLLVNVVGSLIIGFVATVTGPDGRFLAGTPTRQFLMVGLLGGYTTFSAFSLQTLDLILHAQWIPAGLNIAASIVLCLVAVWAGHVAAGYCNAFKWM